MNRMPMHGHLARLGRVGDLGGHGGRRPPAAGLDGRLLRDRRWAANRNACVGPVTGAACTVDLSCGAAANACLTPGVEVRNPSATAAVDGACASTESAGCLKGTTYSNRPDIELKDGECGLKKDECVNGTFADRDDTDSEYRWRCEGIDAEDRWSCLGVAGSRNWSCSYANQSKACGVPIAAKDDNTCGDGEVTQEASDSPLCVLCKDGYETHGGACVAECGANEVRGTDGKCVCETGLSRVNGKCVKLHRLTVEVDPQRKGTVTSSDTTSRYFSCSTSCSTHVEDGRDVALSVSSETGYSCELTDDSFKMTSDKSVTANCDCADGYAEDPQGDCVRVRTLTVNVSPQGAATVTTDDTLDGVFSCSASCSKQVEGNRHVSLSVTPDADYECKFASNGGTTVSFTMSGDRTENVSCDCADGYNSHGGACVRDPYCPTPLKENHCGPATATLIDVADTVVHSKRHGTKAEGCEAGQYFAEEDKPPQHGACGSKVNQCGHGIEAANKSETTSAYRWDCGGVAGVGDHWGCRGTDGHLKWQCRSGLKTESCQIAETGTDSEAKTALPANTAKCLKCKVGYAEENGVCKKLYPVECDPVPTKGKITGDGFTCPGGVLKRTVKEGQTVGALTATPNTGYKFDGWSLVGASCDEQQQPSTCTFKVERNVKFSAQFSTTLEADAGGEHKAVYISVPPPLGSGAGFYFTTVTATASGGLRPYTKFQWSGRDSGATVNFTYPTRSSLPAYETVTVTDSNGETDDDTATIVALSTSAARDGSSEPFRFEVPLGGEAHFIWGGGEPMTARSKDTGVVGVSVSSPAFRVTGVGLGETVVVVGTEDGEWALPMAVR